MTFQVQALPAEEFEKLFTLSDAELAQRNARRMVVADTPGTPCRVSLAEADVGETVLLMNYAHQPANSPYQSTHAIYVRQGVTQADLPPGEIPHVLSSRLIALRQFDGKDMIIDADVLDGTELKKAITSAFENPDVAYLHLHNAKRGCFAAAVTRVEG